LGLAPREVLRRVIGLFEARGWRPVVAPELEFYLCEPNLDSDYPLTPPSGRSGRPEVGRQSYGIDAVNEFDPLFEDMYDYCEAQRIDVDTLIHEAGAAQVEINFIHGDPLALADQTFLFKRTVRQAAHRHKVYATFMAKPYEAEPGSALHIHQSLVDAETGVNLFADDTGRTSPLFLSYIAGLQRYLPDAMALIGPNVNSYRRLVRNFAAPVNTHWGTENRTVGLRVPDTGPAARRVENRVPGADANPYIAFAASLACGYLGMVAGLTPTAPFSGVAYRARGHDLPRHLLDAMATLKRSDALHEVLGAEFVTLFLDVKRAEHEAYQQVISAWEREHLLLNV
ncbi:MAG: glutamine synthetase, partial [Pseudomonadota bacterium]